MRTLFDLVFHLHQVPVLEILEIKDKLSMNEIMSLQVKLMEKNPPFFESAGDFAEKTPFFRKRFQLFFFSGWDHKRGCDGAHIRGRDHQKPARLRFSDSYKY